MTAFAFTSATVDVDHVRALLLDDGRPRVIVEGATTLQFDSASARRFATSLLAAADAADALAEAQA